MSKEFGIAKGKKLKAFGYRQGVSSAGKWQFFSYIEKVKDSTGTWIPAQKYTIWCNNDETLNLQNGQDVEIGNITSVVPSNEEYTSRSGQKIKQRVINVHTTINIKVQQHNNNKQVSSSNFVPQSFENQPFDDNQPFDNQQLNEETDFSQFDDLPDEDLF